MMLMIMKTMIEYAEADDDDNDGVAGFKTGLIMMIILTMMMRMIILRKSDLVARIIKVLQDLLHTLFFSSRVSHRVHGLIDISSNLFKLIKLSNSDIEDTPKVEINFDLLF